MYVCVCASIQYLLTNRVVGGMSSQYNTHITPQTNTKICVMCEYCAQEETSTSSEKTTKGTFLDFVTADGLLCVLTGHKTLSTSGSNKWHPILFIYIYRVTLAATDKRPRLAHKVIHIIWCT